MRTKQAPSPPVRRIALAVAVAMLLGCGGAGAPAASPKAKRSDAPKAPPVARKPDYAALRLKGNGHRQDSFSLALQAAARLLGRDAEYETICALSTNAFSPRVNPGEDCTAWWHVDAPAGGDVGIQTVAARIGLKARLLAQAPFRGDWQKQADRVAHLKAVAKIMRQAMDRGEVILTMGGWEAKQSGRFVPWCWAGVIVEARPDGTILGACLNGRKDNRMAFVPNCWILSAARPTLTAYEADWKMLDNAVARIRGSRRPFIRMREGPAFGLDAIDLWIRRMQRVPFCQPCFKSAPDRVWTCAHNNGETTRSASKVAAAYLRKRKGSFPPKAQPHLEAAAKRYDRIAKLLEPAVTGKGGEHYKQFIGDLAKQKLHAEKVLKPIRQELSAAAGEMDKARAVLGPQEPQRPQRPQRTQRTPRQLLLRKRNTLVIFAAFVVLVIFVLRPRAGPAAGLPLQFADRTMFRMSWKADSRS